MAAGSQAQKGTWALLVKQPKIKQIAVILFSQKEEYQKILKSPKGKSITTAQINSPSPRRLVKAVINPALKDFILE